MLYLYFVPFIGFQIKYDDDDDDETHFVRSTRRSRPKNENNCHNLLLALAVVVPGPVSPDRLVTLQTILPDWVQ